MPADPVDVAVESLANASDAAVALLKLTDPLAGTDPAGSSVAAVMAHNADPDAHPELARVSDIGETPNLGTLGYGPSVSPSTIYPPLLLSFTGTVIDPDARPTAASGFAIYDDATSGVDRVFVCLRHGIRVYEPTVYMNGQVFHDSYNLNVTFGGHYFREPQGVGIYAAVTLYGLVVPTCTDAQAAALQAAIVQPVVYLSSDRGGKLCRKPVGGAVVEGF